MPKGVKASSRQKVSGRKNLSKAHVTRIGKRGMHYKPRTPR